MPHAAHSLLRSIAELPESYVSGQVCGASGLLIECLGIARFAGIGERCMIDVDDGAVPAEVVGFREDVTLLMPYRHLEGVRVGSRVTPTGRQSAVFPHESWRGRVVDAFGMPVDGGPPLPQGGLAYAYRNSPPPAHARRRIGPRMDIGVRALDCFVPCCEGQRLGIFAGSGVGKSTLISMIARYAGADVNVIGLIGERGREVQEFIEDDLGEEGMARTVLVVATSDQSALMRRQAAYLSLSIAEYFRDQGKHVLCLLDSITRLAMAQREIGLSVGEPPTTKGYTPTVFAELPKLLERAGPGAEGTGSITGLFSVLVDGDDHNEPIADAVRGILDGHVVMDRRIAERGRFPAIDVLKSVSRLLPGCHSEAENALLVRARALLSAYTDMEDMIRLGAYRKGSDPHLDEAIARMPSLEAFFSQRKEEHSTAAESFARLETVLNAPLGNMDASAEGG